MSWVTTGCRWYVGGIYTDRNFSLLFLTIADEQAKPAYIRKPVESAETPLPECSWELLAHSDADSPDGTRQHNAFDYGRCPSRQDP